MSRLVKLTSPEDTPLYVNPAQVLYVERDERENVTRLHVALILDGALVWLPVKESPTVVQGLFLEPLR